MSFATNTTEVMQVQGSVMVVDTPLEETFEILKTNLHEWKLPEILPYPMTSNHTIGTIGVPNEWNKMITDTIFRTVNSEASEISAFKRFAIFMQPALKKSTMFYLIIFCRFLKTTDCWDTKNTIHTSTQKLKDPSSKKWTINPAYCAFLKKVSDCFKDNLNNIMLMDMSLRHKKSKIDPSTTISCATGSFAFVNYLPDSEDAKEAPSGVHTWINIESSDDLFQTHLIQPVPKTNENTCAQCKKGPQHGIKRLARCSGCKKVYYCCKEHQRNHWIVHKEKCSNE